VEGLNNTVFEDLVTTALPHSAKLMQLLFGKQITYSIAAVARLGVADHMSATPVAIELLAEKVGAQTPSLYRVMRMLSSVGVFRQTERQFSLTPVGELLRSDHKNSGRSISRKSLPRPPQVSLPAAKTEFTSRPAAFSRARLMAAMPMS